MLMKFAAVSASAAPMLTNCNPVILTALSGVRTWRNFAVPVASNTPSKRRTTALSRDADAASDARKLATLGLASGWKLPNLRSFQSLNYHESPLISVVATSDCLLKPHVQGCPGRGVPYSDEWGK